MPPSALYMTPIMPSSLGAVLHPFSPPSARAQIKVLLSLYEKTGGATYLEQIRGIISYVKQYNHIVKPNEPGYKSRRRATNPKWDCDIKNIHMYEFVYSEKEMGIESTAAMLEELLVTNPDFANASYKEFITPINLKNLKYALLVSGEKYLYTEFKSLQCFIVKGCYLLQHREEHPVYHSRAFSAPAPVIAASASRVHLENAIATEDTVLAMLAKESIETARALKPDQRSPIQKLKAKGKEWKERLSRVDEEEDEDEESTTDDSPVTRAVSPVVDGEGESDQESTISVFDRVAQKGSAESVVASSSEANGGDGGGGLGSHVRRFMGSVVSFCSQSDADLLRERRRMAKNETEGT